VYRSDGCESWILNIKTAKKINAFVMNCLRIISGHRKIERIRNEVILKITSMKPITDIIKERLTKYTYRTMCMNENSYNRIYLTYTPDFGKNRRGRPRLNYSDYIRTHVGIDLANIFLTQDALPEELLIEKILLEEEII
jgi:hypothetical protein